MDELAYRRKKVDYNRKSGSKFTNPKNVIDLIETSIVETQQNESGAKNFSELYFPGSGSSNLQDCLDEFLQS